MERAVWFAAATWVGGVGAWGVGVGYALGAARARTWGQPPPAGNPRMALGPEGDAPTPPTEVVDVDSLPAPPLPLDAPTDGGRRGAGMRSAAPDAVPTFDSLDDMDEFLLRREAAGAAALESIPEDDSDDADSELELEPQALTSRAADASELDLRPPDASALLSESQRRRLAPIKPLKRERRSRKIRRATPKEDTFVPLVPGARATQEEAILNSYTGETIDVKREQGEDYWVDPVLVQEQVKSKEAVRARTKQFKTREDAFGEQRLKQEMAAPYKNNLIGLIVVGIGVVSAVFAAFPGLLELNEPPSIASFPDTL